jgi:small-conductance mechanosensitive channel
MDTISNHVEQWIDQHTWQLLVTLGLLALYILLDRLASPRLAEGAENSRLKSESVRKAVRTARVITAVFGLLILTIVWGLDIGSVIIFATTAITLLGVALFASWSILSNVTAYFILVLHPSFRRGNFIRVFEADNYAEGYISDVMLFSTKLVTEDREIIVYPNNQLLGRPAVINPRDRLNGVGKLPPAA